MITIGIDPHKRTHTAVAIDEQRRKLDELEVVASARMARLVLDWARAWPSRCWAVEGSDGLGKLLAQQLVAGRRDLDHGLAGAGRPRPAAAHRSWPQDRHRRAERGRDRRSP